MFDILLLYLSITYPESFFDEISWPGTQERFPSGYFMDNSKGAVTFRPNIGLLPVTGPMA